MIRSGLVNQRMGGGFEKGYPHEKGSTNETLRPYVDGFDTGYGTRSDFQTVALPVTYANIFSKKLTADERLYIVRQVQQGRLKDMQGLPLPDSVDLPDSVESDTDSAIDMSGDVVDYFPPDEGMDRLINSNGSYPRIRVQEQ